MYICVNRTPIGIICSIQQSPAAQDNLVAWTEAPREEAPLVRVVFRSRMREAMSNKELRAVLQSARETVSETLAKVRDDGGQWPRDLQRLRKYLGVTQTMIARIAGTNFSDVSRWEKGLTAPDIREMTRLFDFVADLGLSMPLQNWLSGYRPHPQLSRPGAEKGKHNVRRKRQRQASPEGPLPETDSAIPYHAGEECEGAG